MVMPGSLVEEPRSTLDLVMKPINELSDEVGEKDLRSRIYY